MVLHFGLVMSVLLFNILNLVEFLIRYSYDSSCSTKLNIVYFIFAIDTWVWDCFELALDLLLLYIVSSSLESLSRSESHDDSAV